MLNTSTAIHAVFEVSNYWQVLLIHQKKDAPRLLQAHLQQDRMTRPFISKPLII